MPSSSITYQKIIPAWWMSSYPLTYYFIGCYLKEYEIKLKRKWSIVLLFCSVLLFATFCFYRYYNSKIVEVAGDYQEWGSFFIVIQSVLIFITIKKIKEVNKLPPQIKKMIKYLSDLALGAYLVSSIFDSVFYPKFNEAVKEVPHKLEYFMIIILGVLVFSFLTSAIVDLSYQILLVIVKKIKFMVMNRRG